MREHATIVSGEEKIPSALCHQLVDAKSSVTDDHVHTSMIEEVVFKSTCEIPFNMATAEHVQIGTAHGSGLCDVVRDSRRATERFGCSYFENLLILRA